MHAATTSRRLTLGALALALSALTAGVTHVGTAHAQAVQPITEASTDALSFADLGYAEGIELAGLNAAETIFIPVGGGLQPEQLVLTILPTPFLPEGYLSVSSGDIVQARIPLPKDEATLRIPLRRVNAVGGKMPIRIETAIEGDDYCEAFFLHRLYVVPQSEIVFSGERTAPTQVSSFFPGQLNRVTFYAPAPLSDEATQAALWLASFLPQRYPAKAPELRIRTYTGMLDDLPATGAFERAVVWDASGSGARVEPLASGGAALRVGGLAEAEQLFVVEGGADVAVTPAFTTSSADLAGRDRRPGRVTLADFDYEDRTIQGAGSISSFFNFSLADFGAERRPTGIRLRVRHTPIPDEGLAYLHTYLNGSLIESAPLEDTRLDVWASFPEENLLRDNTLEVRFAYNSPEGNCTRDVIPMSATIDNASTFTVDGGDVMAAGFERFPQAFVDEFAVYVSPRSPSTVQDAARLVSALQATTRMPLIPRLTSALPATGDLLAVGTTALAADLDAPLRGEMDLRRMGRDGRLAFDPSTGYAALQGYRENLRDVLLLTYTPGADYADALLDDLLEPTGWFGVRGALALRGERGGSASVLDDRPLAAASLDEPVLSFLERYRFWLFVVIAVLVLLLLIWLYSKVVRPVERYPQYEPVGGAEGDGYVPPAPHAAQHDVHHEAQHEAHEYYAQHEASERERAYREGYADARAQPGGYDGDFPTPPETAYAPTPTAAYQAGFEQGYEHAAPSQAEGYPRAPRDEDHWPPSAVEGSAPPSSYPSSYPDPTYGPGDPPPARRD
jgi:hypothetical protein